MPDALEEAALSGALFQPRERSGTPTRSDDGSDDSVSEDGSSPQPQASESSTALIPEYDETHAKGAQTGIKGVLNDKKAHTRSSNARQQEEQRDLKGRMEKMALVGNTWREEEEIRAREKNEEEDGDGIDDWRKKRMDEMKLGRGLREVGKEGFVSAVEKAGWVVVLMYEPDIPRCQHLLQEMTTLSTTLQSSTTTLSTPVTLLRARATTLSFSLLPSSTPRANDEDDEDDGEEEAEADPDVLPTILAYKDGELERNWIRVDWEIGDGTLEELLRREGILPTEGYDDRVHR